MSEEGGAAPAPWVPDASVLIEVARGDARTVTFVQELDARGRPLVIPALAVTGASLDIRGDEAVCPIITLDAAKWRQHAGSLDDPLHIIEIAEPDEPPG